MKYRFGACVLDVAARQLRRDGNEVHISPKAFELLKILIERRPTALPKGDIHDHLWRDTFVSDDSLARLATEVRAAIGDSARQPHFVRTVHGFGYAFAGDVVEEKATATPIASRAPSRHLVIWDKGEVLLREGVNVVGRDEAAEVWLDSARVSRQHARLMVEGARVTLEDLGSKNGTHFKGERITGPVSLEDGDTFQIGAITLALRAQSVGSTETDFFLPAPGRR